MSFFFFFVSGISAVIFDGDNNGGDDSNGCGINKHRHYISVNQAGNFGGEFSNFA